MFLGMADGGRLALDAGYIQEYKDVARTARIRRFKSQVDVYGLIELVLRT